MAISGNRLARSLKPGRTRNPRHTGQPVPWLVRIDTAAEYLWPSGHNHSYLRAVPADTSVGSQPNASRATSGYLLARSLPSASLTPTRWHRWPTPHYYSNKQKASPGTPAERRRVAFREGSRGICWLLPEPGTEGYARGSRTPQVYLLTENSNVLVESYPTRNSPCSCRFGRTRRGPGRPESTSLIAPIGALPARSLSATQIGL